MYAGININGNKTYSVVVLDGELKPKLVSKFYKEGLFWFLDHFSGKRIVININFSNKKLISQVLKEFFSIYSVLLDTFEFEEFAKTNKNSKTVVITDTDLYFTQFIRKNLLPVYTREGLEQRVYNLKKVGLYIDYRYFSKEKKELKNQINALVSAYTSHLIDKDLYTMEKKENLYLVIPKYKYVFKNRDRFK